MKRGIIICTGLMKSGTHSLQKMIGDSVHEYRVDDFIKMLILYKENKINKNVFSKFLCKHFEENQYRCFISHVYMSCFQEISELYPQVKYIFSFREWEQFVYSYYNHLFMRRHKSKPCWKIYHRHLQKMLFSSYSYNDFYLKLFRLPSLRHLVDIYCTTAKITDYISSEQKYILFIDHLSQHVSTLTQFINQDIKEQNIFHTPHSKFLTYILPKNYIQTCYTKYIVEDVFVQKVYSSLAYVI